MSACPTAVLRLLTGVALLILVACRATPPPPLTGGPRAHPGARPPAVPRPVPQVLFDWKGGDLAGPVAMRIDLSEQKAVLTRGGQPAGWTYVAAGVSTHPTPTGSFRIVEKVRDKHSNTWGIVVDAYGNTVISDAKNGRDPVPPGGRFKGASMPYWMRITGAVGMHAGPIPHPGLPASHGCIRLPRGMAEILFRVTSIGTAVEVVP